MFNVFRRKKPEPVPEPAVKTPPADPAPAPEPPVKQTASTTQYKPAKDAAARVGTDKSPEELCGVTPGMDKEKIHEQLAMLFRRHNRAASSLDDKLRTEAELMLDAIVAVRERHLES